MDKNSIFIVQRKLLFFFFYREKAVTYLNEYAEFVDPHTLKTVNKKGKEKTVTSDKFILAMGGRPKYPGIPGDKVSSAPFL